MKRPNRTSCDDAKPARKGAVAVSSCLLCAALIASSGPAWAATLPAGAAGAGAGAGADASAGAAGADGLRAQAITAGSAVGGLGVQATAAGSAANAGELGAEASVKDGMYTFTSSAANLRLSVNKGSWKTGAGMQLAAAKSSVAQKFNVRKTSGSYYRITMALSGTALEAQGSAATAKVKTASAGTKARQLWRIRSTADGLVFVNKATGSVLGVEGRAASGARVGVEPVAAAGTSDAASQAWKLAAANVKSNVKSFSTLKTLVAKAPKGGNRTVKVSAKGTGYKMSKVRSKRLKSALKAVWKRGANASFVLIDLDTGITVSCGANRGNHGASTFKAAYVTYLYQSFLEKGRKLDGSTRSLMAQTIGQSSNEAYLALRGKYGTGGFRKWLRTIGLGGLANSPYPRLTARNLARVWAKLYSYEHSGGKYVKQWRKNFNHSYFSFIRESLGGKNKVYSKPGWYPKMGAKSAALNDGAIVKHRNGRSYLLTVLSDVNCYSDRAVMRKLVKELDAIHREMPRG